MSFSRTHSKPGVQRSGAARFLAGRDKLWFNHARYDGAGRVNRVSGVLSGANTTYASLDDDAAGGIKAYAAHGGVQRLTRGDGIPESTTWNSRLQVQALAAGTLWSANLYYCDGEALQCATNNGNLLEQKVTARPDASAAAAILPRGLRKIMAAALRRDQALLQSCPV